MGVIPLVDGVVDIDRRVVLRGTETRLSVTEARLLDHLARRSGRAWTRDELQVEVWGYRAGVSSRTVFTTVGRLRTKIEADPGAPRHLVTVPGEGYRFAPLDAAPVALPRATLPRPPTPFVGRAAELEALGAILDGGARLVTLLGPGGAGKTRLAIALAERRVDPYGLTAFVPLEAVEAAAAVPPAVGRALGVDLGGVDDGEAALFDRLGGESALLVLDNFEQIVGAAGFVERLLAACPNTVAVVTSRVRLGLRREVAVTVAGMGVPTSAEGMESEDAGRLLLDAAARARPGWTPSPEEREVLTRICRVVDGAPLAIELAAAWLRLLDPAEIAAELDSSLDILASSHADVPDRHRSVRAALDASWSLLAPAAARALAALSVFRGAFDRRAAEAVAGADLLILGQLVDSSMVRRREGRFDLHPLVRQTAAERLGAGARVAARRAHGAWYLGRLGAVDGFDVADAELVAIVGDDHDELAGAAAWAVEVREAELLGACFDALFRHYEIAGRVPELLVLLHDIQSAFDGEPSGPARDRLLGLAITMTLGLGTGPVDTARARALLEGVGGSGLILGLINTAILSLVRGGVAEQVPTAERAVALAGRREGEGLLGFASSVLGSLLMAVGRFEEARRHLDEAVRIGEGKGGQPLGRPLVHRGELRLATGDFPGAVETLQRALRVTRDAGDRRFTLLALCRLGEALEGQGSDPDPPWIEALEDGLAERLPVYWWARALVGLARRVVLGRLGDEPGFGAGVLAFAEGRLPMLDETRARAREGLAWARERGLSEAPLDASPEAMAQRLLAL